jgi:endonuclease/exonuclease/phosphatase family metal-dependent hydrolase
LTKSAVIAVALFLGACGSSEDSKPEPARPVTVMTYNVLCSVCKVGEYDPWNERLVDFTDIFQRHDPDLLGIQELTPLSGEVDSFLETLPGRAAVYFAPEDRPPYPDAAIVYRKSRFSVIEHGEYWLSPTPEKPSSTGFSPPQLPRLVVWALLHDKAGDRELFFASTHFDNNSPSQELSAPLVQERTAPWVATHPVVFVGDFNSRPDSAAYATLTTDASRGFVFQNTYDLSPSQRVVSNQDPAPAFDATDRIDHIFVAGEQTTFDVTDWAVDLSVYGAQNRYPSDHFPVASTLDYQ